MNEARKRPLGEPCGQAFPSCFDNASPIRRLQLGNVTIAPAFHVPGKIEAEVESFNRRTAEASAWAATKGGL